MTIMLKVREKTVRTIGLNKFSYIEIMIFAVNIFFKIIRKNNIKIFNIEIKFNIIIDLKYRTVKQLLLFNIYT